MDPKEIHHQGDRHAMVAQNNIIEAIMEAIVNCNPSEALAECRHLCQWIFFTIMNEVVETKDEGGGTPKELEKH